MTRHPLGFARHELRIAGYRLRLHVWSGTGLEDRHSHQYPFVSLPLTPFWESRWIEVPGDSHAHLACETATGTSPMRVLPTPRRAGLRLLKRRLRLPLVPWFCPVSAVHSLEPVGGFGVSLVVCGRVVRAASDVYRKEEK